MGNLIYTLAWILIIVGIFVVLYVRSVPPRTLAIPVFLGGNRLNIILTEGLNALPLLRPFCSLIHHSLEPRPITSFDFSVNAEGAQVKINGTITFQLLKPEEMKEKMNELDVARISEEKNYLLLYDKRQAKIEGMASAYIREMLDELLSNIPSELALRKETNDTIQRAILDGIAGRDAKSKGTTEQKITELINTYKKAYAEKMDERKVTVREAPEITLFAEGDLPSIRGLKRMFLEDYGVSTLAFTLAIEPSEEIAKARTEYGKRDIERDIEETDTMLVISMMKKVKEALPNLSDQEAKDLVMVVQEYYAQPQAYALSVTGLEKVPPETLLALGQMYTAGKAVTGGKKKGGKKL